MQGDAPTPDGQVADAVKGNWVDLYAPAPARPYLRLSRADRPAGTWLLLLPGLYSLALAIAATVPLALLVFLADDSGAMFLAYLTIVPAMAVFIVNIETRFFEHYQRFYRDIEHHANYERIEENHQNLIDALLAASRNVIVLQFCLCVTAILVAGPLFHAVGIPALQLGIFRFGVLSALFHVLLMFVGIVLAYFDLRKVMLGVQLLYLVTNGLFTWVTMELGFAYYGYGYFLASLVTFLIAYGVCAWHVGRLPFLTFVRNNASV